MPLCMSGLRGRPGGTDSAPAGIMGKLHNKQAFYTAFLNIRILTAFVKQKNKKIPPEGDIFVIPETISRVFHPTWFEEKGFPSSCAHHPGIL